MLVTLTPILKEAAWRDQYSEEIENEAMEDDRLMNSIWSTAPNKYAVTSVGESHAS
jgi:hypothetical protein